MAEMAGLIRHDGERIDSTRVEAVLQHLGPGTGNGMVLLGEAAMIHTRYDLATLPERQPVQNADGTLCATVLGCPQWGETGQQTQDGLVPRELLEFYQARGPAAFRYLWGQWAAAIWDAPRHRLVLARGWDESPDIWVSDDNDVFTYSTNPDVIEHNHIPCIKLGTQQTQLIRIRQSTAVMV